MKKLFFFICLLLSFSLGTDGSWAMEVGGEPWNLVLSMKHPPCLHPEGLQLTQWDENEIFYRHPVFRWFLPINVSVQLINPQIPREELPSTRLDLSRKTLKDWSDGLKNYCQIEECSWRSGDWLRYGISLGTGLIRQPSKYTINYVGLHEVDLQNTYPVGSEGKALVRGILKHAPHLIKLNVSRNGVHDLWLEETLFDGSPSLEHLNLSHNLITGDGTQLAYTFYYFPKLKTLDVSYNKLGGSVESRKTVRWCFGPPSFGFWSMRPSSLQYLNLSGNPVAGRNANYGNELLKASFRWSLR